MLVFENYGDEEEFWEQQESEILAIVELKEKIKSGIKKEFIQEMERLKKENEELSEIKDNFEKVKEDYLDKKIQLEKEYKKRKEELETNKLDEIFKNIKHKMYTLGCEVLRMEKCEKCDENRYIGFMAPNNKEMRYRCDCYKTKRRYIVKEIELYSFEKSKNGVNFIFFSESDDKYNIKNIFNFGDEDSIEKLYEKMNSSGSYYAHEEIIFKQKEKADEFVKFVNERQVYE